MTWDPWEVTLEIPDWARKHIHGRRGCARDLVLGRGLGARVLKKEVN